MEYLKRTADEYLSLLLASSGAVLIEGPKWCGKTTTAEQQANSVIRLQDPDMRDKYQSTIRVKPSLLLSGGTPRLIDEWQEAPVLWDSVRVMVDKRNEFGQFILTGSNSIDPKKKSEFVKHSGSGRIAKMQMLPMSLYESLESNGKISIKELFDNQDLDIDGVMSDMSIEELIFAACRGGWPASLYAKFDKAKLQIAKNYVQIVCSTDMSTIDGVRRNEKVASAILQSYARNISTLAKKTVVYRDVNEHLEGVSTTSFDAYLDALERLFVIQDIDAWSPAIRSSSAIRRGSKREFVDPSIAVAALGLSPEALYTDLKTFGFLFECMAIRDLKAYSLSLGGSMSYYHDRYDLEADAVLHIDDGRYALIEFKLGSREIEEGAEHLKEIKRLVQEHNITERQIKLREPDLLMVITGGEMAYTRPDGVKVIPLACLKD
ncbi:MAG: ATP-binding protein [Prevotella koreensis]|uniref:ATP-binding protein n=1 Tax=Prevotella koreensis TaxID=2490854 RepID=UPI003F9F2A1C